MKLSFGTFLEKKKESLNGMFVFSSDSCGMCNIYKKNLKTFPYEFDYVDIVLNSEKVELFSIFKDSSIPFTVVYKDNKIEYIKNGILMEYQFIQLNKKMKELQFDVVTQKEKPKEFKNVIVIASDEFINKGIIDCISHGEFPYHIKSIYLNVNDIDVKEQLDESWTGMCNDVVVYKNGELDSVDILILKTAVSTNKNIIYRTL